LASLEQLGRYQAGNTTQLDMIMTINKTTVATLNEFVSGLDENHVNGRCLMLCTLTMQAVEDFYSQVLESWLRNEQCLGGGAGVVEGNQPKAPQTLPAFGFGMFKIDQSSQTQMFKQIFIREVELALVVCRKIWALMCNYCVEEQVGKGVCETAFLRMRDNLARIRADAC
jgi:hypothetical protein